MNRGAIVDAALAIYNEETGDYISEAYLNARYNEAKSRLERRTRCYPISSTSDLTDSTRTKILPVGLFAIRKRGVIVAGYGIIPPRAWSDVVSMDPLNWATVESACPDCFYMEPAPVTVSSVTNWGIGFYPVPSATITNGVTIYGWGISADATQDADLPPWPTPYHMALVWELCVMAATREIGKEMRNVRPLAHFRGELMDYEREMRSASDEHFVTGATLQVGAGATGTYADDDPIMVINVDAI